MTVVGPRIDWRRQLRSPLVIALVLSLLLHLYVWLMALLLSAALKNGWLPPWLQKVAQPVAALVNPTPPPPPAQPKETWQEVPLQFVEVDPSQVTDQVPEDTKYYSTASTLAANPNPTKVDQLVPKIDGQRENTLKTFDTSQATPKPEAPQPKLDDAPAAEALKAPQEVRKPQEAIETKPQPVGETLLAKADPKAVQPPDTRTPQPAQEAQAAQEPAKPRRPKTLAEARATKGALVGERMKQEGGVTRPALQSSLNVKASPLGDYNYRMILAVQSEWFRLLDDRRFALDRQGQVVITFDLHADGTITSIATKEENVGEVLSYLCELAVMRPAPFGKWPTDIRRIIGGDTIPVTFTFNYY